MLDLWRLHAAHLQPLVGATLSGREAIDTKAYFSAEFNRWYRRLLREAPEQWVKVDEISSRVKLPPSVASDSSTPLTLPDGVVRVVSVRPGSWLRKARIVTDPSDPLILRQLHPYTRATSSRPIALFSDGELRLYPAAAPADRIVSLRCVSFAEGSYDFDDAALAGLHPALQPID